jgi:hypothetical protein
MALTRQKKVFATSLRPRRPIKVKKTEGAEAEGASYRWGPPLLLMVLRCNVVTISAKALQSFVIKRKKAFLDKKNLKIP